MRCSTSAAALVAALSISSVAASPSHHRHAHHHMRHQKKDVDWSKLDWKHMSIDWAAAYSAGIAAEKAASTPAPAPAASSAPAAVPAQAAEESTSIASLWNNLVGLANAVTAFGEEVTASGNSGDFYYGNYGNPYASNMMKVASRDGFDFTNEFINTSDEPMTIVLWNKVGPDLQPLSGSALAPTKPALTFALAPGASQIVAFQDNTQAAWCQATSAKAQSGAFAQSWGEINLSSKGSGYDLSAIMNPNNNNYKMSITSVEAPGCTSDQTQNFWLTATDPVGNSDGSCYIAQSTATLTTKMGGTS